MNLRDLFLTTGRVNALLHIHRHESETYKSRMMRSLETSQPMIDGYLNDFNDHDLIRKKQDGQKKRLSLTSKGSEIARELEKLDRVFKEVENTDE